MRRFYILPKTTWAGTIKVGTAFAQNAREDPSLTPEDIARLIQAGEDGVGYPKQVDVMHPMTWLFHPQIGSHYLNLPNDNCFLMTSLSHDERWEDLFHSHPDVAILPHPTQDGRMPLSQHIGRPGYKFTQAHLDLLTSSPLFKPAIVGTDSLIDVLNKLGHPEFRIRNVL